MLSVRLHLLKFKSICHLNQVFDGKGLKTELHDHVIVHKGVERSWQSLFNHFFLLIFNVKPDLLKHDYVHDVKDLVWQHRYQVLFLKLLVLLLVKLNCLFDGRNDRVFHDLNGFFHHTLVFASSCINET